MKPLFSQAELEAIAGALGETDAGLKGAEIEMLIATCGMTDPGPITKRNRIYNAFADSQNRRGDRTHVLGFIRHAMKPARYVREPGRYEPMRTNLNFALAFAGLTITQKPEHYSLLLLRPRFRRRSDGPTSYVVIWKYGVSTQTSLFFAGLSSWRTTIFMLSRRRLKASRQKCGQRRG